MALGLHFHPQMYLGEGINAEKLDKIKKKLDSKPLMSGVFVITLSRSLTDQLEIYDAKQLVQSYYKKYPPYIVGIAKNHDEAISLVEKIVGDCLRDRGDCALKEYLQC